MTLATVDRLDAFIDQLSRTFAPVSSASTIATKDTRIPTQAVAGDRLEGYCAMWKGSDGHAFIDSYGDETVSGSWQKCIAHWNEERRATGRSHLVPHLYNHSRDEQIGGVLHLAEDSQGVIYQTKLVNTPRAHEVYALAKEGFVGTSYGYDPVQTDYYQKSGKRIRRLLQVFCHEVSSVTYPANPYATANAKNAAPGFPDFERVFRGMLESGAVRASSIEQQHYRENFFNSFPSGPTSDYTRRALLEAREFLKRLQEDRAHREAMRSLSARVSCADASIDALLTRLKP
jgi:HK97 family phage prohead protease